MVIHIYCLLHTIMSFVIYCDHMHLYFLFPFQSLRRVNHHPHLTNSQSMTQYSWPIIVNMLSGRSSYLDKNTILPDSYCFSTKKAVSNSNLLKWTVISLFHTRLNKWLLYGKEHLQNQKQMDCQVLKENFTVLGICLSVECKQGRHSKVKKN